jgi:hypothetical protein
MDPGFLALYKRGNYFRRNLVVSNPEERQRKHEERERFAMAAIGFSLNHHPLFRQHFLKVVCGIKRRLNKNIKVGIEDKLWGDLVVRTQSDIFVIEGKIKAGLRDRQNPAKGAAFWERGYGRAIIEEFGDHTRLHYILLGFPERLSLPKNRKINCRQVFWEHLEDNYPEDVRRGRTDMAAELAECLSELEVDAFYLRKTRKMKTKKPNEAAKAFDILRGTLKELEVKEKITGSTQNDEGEFGSEIRAGRAKKERTAIAKLRRLVKPKHREAIGWLG